jgi:cytoskeletal protein CcmA (bactofilin family)
MDQPHDGAGVELNALLGRGTRYAGNLYFEGRIRLEGHFEGEIRCAETPEDGVLVIGEGADLSGDIEVGVCIVTGGIVKANIRARNAIELHAPCIVRGNLHAPNVFIDRGVQFEGNCHMAPLDVPPTATVDDELTEVRVASEPIEDPADTDPGLGPESR